MKPSKRRKSKRHKKELSRQRKQAAAQRPQSPPSVDIPEKSFWSLFLRRFWKTLGIIGTVVTLAGFFLSVATRLSVYPQDVIDPMKPFDTPFILENQGYLSVYSVSVETGIDKVTYESGTTVQGMDMVNKNDWFYEVGPSKRISVWLRTAFNFPSAVATGKLSMVVKYRPMFWFRREQEFAFQMRRNASGQLVWLPVAN